MKWQEYVNSETVVDMILALDLIYVTDPMQCVRAGCTPLLWGCRSLVKRAYMCVCMHTLSLLSLYEDNSLVYKLLI